MSNLSRIKLISIETLAIILIGLLAVLFWRTRALSNQLADAQIEREQQAEVAATAQAIAVVEMQATQNAMQASANAELNALAGIVNELQNELTMVAEDSMLADDDIMGEEDPNNVPLDTATPPPSFDVKTPPAATVTLVPTAIPTPLPSVTPLPIPPTPEPSTQISVRDDSYFTQEEITLSRDRVGGVLSNDTDPTGSGLSIVTWTQTMYGLLTLGSDGAFQYRPNADYAGADSFTYTACNTSDQCATANVMISVTANNDTPQAFDDVIQFSEDDTSHDITNDILLNDIDPENDPLSIISISTTALDRVIFDAGSGTVQYRLNGAFNNLHADETATDTFVYTIRDAQQGISSSATVTIIINGQNDVPVAGSDPDSPAEHLDLTFGKDTVSVLLTTFLLNDDTDPDTGDQAALTITEIDNNAQGGYAVLIGGQVEYRLDGAYQHLTEGESVTDRFSYVVADPSGAESNTALVIVTITFADSE